MLGVHNVEYVPLLEASMVVQKVISIEGKTLQKIWILEEEIYSGQLEGEVWH